MVSTFPPPLSSQLSLSVSLNGGTLLKGRSGGTREVVAGLTISDGIISTFSLLCMFQGLVTKQLTLFSRTSSIHLSTILGSLTRAQSSRIAFSETLQIEHYHFLPLWVSASSASLPLPVSPPPPQVSPPSPVIPLPVSLLLPVSLPSQFHSSSQFHPPPSFTALPVSLLLPVSLPSQFTSSQFHNLESVHT